MMSDFNWEGVENKIAEHRTVGPHRAWCFNCHEWCYSDGEHCQCCMELLMDDKYEIHIRRDIIGWEWQVTTLVDQFHAPYAGGYALTRKGAIKAAERAIHPVPKRGWIAISSVSKEDVQRDHAKDA